MSLLELPTIVQRFKAEVSGMSEMSGEMSSMESNFKTKATSVATGLTKYLTVPLIAAAGASVILGTKFQAQMELIHTQAGASQAEVNKMSQAVLNLAGPTATSPMELAQSLYHIESTGARGAKALNILTLAAEGAKIGNSNLEDTTNALNATVVSGIKGAQNYKQAMATLNATVGSGDMKMQDLADAMGTGILASSKTFGLSLKDIGAALATLGDNNIRGAKAATELRMSLALMAAPSETAGKALNSIGLSADQLGEDMRKPNGLLVALEDLKKHLNSPIDASQFSADVKTATSGLTAMGLSTQQTSAFIAKYGAQGGNAAVELNKMGLSTQQVLKLMTSMGPSAAEQAVILSKAFGGGRTSSTILVLLSQLDRLKSKYKDITEAEKNFGGDWKSTQHTFKFQMDQLGASAEAMSTRMGLALLPALETIVRGVSKVISWFSKIPGPVKDAAIGLVAFTAVVAPLVLIVGKLLDSFKQISSTLSTVGQKMGLLNKTPAAAPVEGATETETEDVAVQAPGEGSLISKLGASFRSLGSTIADGMKGALSGLKSMFTSIAQSMGLMSEASEEVAAGEVAIGDAAEEATPEVVTLNEGMDANPIMAIVTVLALLAVGIYEAYKHCKPFRDALDDVGRWFTGVGKDVIQWAKDFKQWMVDAFDWVRSHWALLGAILLAPIAPVLAIFLLFHNQIIHFFEDIWNQVSRIWTTLFNTLRSVTTTVVRALEVAWDGFWSVFDAVLKEIVSLGLDVLQGAVELFETQWNIAWTIVHTIVSTAWSIMKPIFSFIVSMGIDLIQGAITTLQLIWSTTWSTIQAILSTAWAVMKSVFTFIITLGIDVLEGAINALQSTWDTVWSAVQTAVSTAWGVVGPILSDVVNLGLDAITDAVNGLKSAWDTVWGGLKTAVQDAWDAIKPIISKISGAMSDVTGALGDVTGFLGSMLGIGGGSSPAKRATGGPVAMGQSYIVGEQGPELFTPGATGQITNAQNLAAAFGEIDAAMTSGGMNIRIPSISSTSSPEGMDPGVGAVQPYGAPMYHFAPGSLPISVGSTDASVVDIAEAVAAGVTAALDEHDKQLRLAFAAGGGS